MEAIAAMEREGHAMLAAANILPEQRELRRMADVRYRRQAYELTVPIPDGAITRASLDAVAETFHAKHQQTYGHANRVELVQLVNLRVTALGRLPNVRIMQRADRAKARETERAVWFADAGMMTTPVLWRDGLLCGTQIAGPAIIEALDSTVLVPPGWQAGVDTEGYLRIGRAA